MESLSIIKIDQNYTSLSETFPAQETCRTTASVSLEMGGLAMKFAKVERAPRYDDEHKENDVEHSYMLALLANELALMHYPEMNAGKVTQFSIVHDLIETVNGDVPTFTFTAEQMAQKQSLEHEALEELLLTLPPHTARLVYEYEQQQTIEARFVKAVDKLLPVVVDILGSGKKVMKEVYGVTTAEQLKASHDRLHDRIAMSFEEFPLIVGAHNSLCRLFQEEFEPVATR